MAEPNMHQIVYNSNENENIKNMNEEIDITRICRICVEEKPNLVNIKQTFESKDKRSTLKDIYNDCSPVQIQYNDGYPERFCIGCLSDLLKTYEFRQKCLHSIELLEARFSQSQSDDENSVPETVVVKKRKFIEIDEPSTSNQKKSENIDFENCIVKNEIIFQSSADGYEQVEEEEEETVDDLKFDSGASTSANIVEDVVIERYDVNVAEDIDANIIHKVKKDMLKNMPRVMLQNSKQLPLPEKMADHPDKLKEPKPAGNKKKSIVWNYFDKAGDTATCRLCQKKLKFFQNTSNFMQHLLRIHPQQLTEDEEEVDPLFLPVMGTLTNEKSSEPTIANISRQNTVTNERTIASMISRQRAAMTPQRPSELTKKEIDVIDKCLLKMISIDYQPLSLVENSGFLEYSHKLQPLYKPPSMQKLSLILLPEMYMEIVPRVKIMLNSVDYVAITTDKWTSDTNEEYITVSCHFIYNDKLYAPVIATRELTRINIAATLSSVFMEWRIENKIVTIVSDNGSNIKNAVEQLKLNHQACVAHTLNVCVNDAIEANATLINLLNKCRLLINHFKLSGTASKQLLKAQTKIGFQQLKLKQDVTKKWNSILTMLERLLLVKESLLEAVTDLPNPPQLLDSNDWSIISDCVPILKPLQTMANELCKEKYVTVSLVIPLIQGLQLKIKKQQPETQTGINLKNTLINLIQTNLASLETDQIISKSTLLDPRLKKAAFAQQENASNAENYLKEELISLLDSVEMSDFNTEESDSSLWSFFEKQLSEVQSTKESIATQMLRQYIEMVYLSRGKNPHDFWKQYKVTMPDLYKLQLKYLAIPATCIPATRIFSKGGLLTNLRRNCLLSKNLNEIIFLNSCFNGF